MFSMNSTPIQIQSEEMLATDNFLAYKKTSRGLFGIQQVSKGWTIHYLTGDFNDEDSGIRFVLTVDTDFECESLMALFEKRVVEYKAHKKEHSF